MGWGVVDWCVSINVVDWSGMSWGVVDWCVGVSVVDWSGMGWGVVDWLSVRVSKVVSGDIISVLMARVVWGVAVGVGRLVVWSI